MHNWAEVNTNYQGGVNVFGVGNLAAHNELYNSPHTAIFLCLAGSHNLPHTKSVNNTIEFNLIHDVCLESTDAGAIYWGCSWTDGYGSVVRNNVIYNIGKFGENGNKERTPMGIYPDGAASGTTIENNLLVNIPEYAFHTCGRDIIFRGNVIANGGTPIHYTQAIRDASLEQGWTNPDSEDYVKWGNLYNSPWQTEAWRKAFPKLAAYTDDPSNPDVSTFAPNPADSSVKDNIIVGPVAPYYDESVPRFSEIGPNEEYGAWAGRKYWTLPGYEKTEIERIGREAR